MNRKEEARVQEDFSFACGSGFFGEGDSYSREVGMKRRIGVLRSISFVYIIVRFTI